MQSNSLKLLITPAERYHQTVLETMKHLVLDRKLGGVYVTLNRSCGRLRDMLSKEAIPSGDIYFIDAVTKAVSLSEDRENCLYVPDPGNLSELSISVSKTLGSLESRKRGFIVFDSASTLLLYDKSQHISRFLHSLTAELRRWDLEEAVVFSIKGEFDEDTVNTFSGFFDCVERAD